MFLVVSYSKAGWEVCLYVMSFPVFWLVGGEVVGEGGKFAAEKFTTANFVKYGYQGNGEGVCVRYLFKELWTTAARIWCGW